MSDKKILGEADPSLYEKTIYPDPEPSAPETQKVGYRSPPIDTRFRTGVSGNPFGRPRGRKNFKTAIKDILTEKIRVRIGNNDRRITKLEAAFMKMLEKALKGDLKAIQAVAATAKVSGLLDEPPLPKLMVRDLDHFSEEELQEFERLIVKASGRIVP